LTITTQMPAQSFKKEGPVAAPHDGSTPYQLAIDKNMNMNFMVL
jgi:hypothetical protein